MAAFMASGRSSGNATRRATSVLIATSIILLCNAQAPMTGTITFLISTVERTQRTLSCPGEALTLTCTSNGTGIIWNSEPSLTMLEDQTSIYGFVHNESAGTSFSYLRNYTNGTAFFVTTVLEDVVIGGSCNSSITFVPIPNDEGKYPIFFAPSGLFNITCDTPRSLSPRYWEYRVAAVPMRVPESNATCTYYAPHKVVRIEIMRQDITQDSSVELSRYEVSMNGMKTNVSAQSGSPSGLFYPVHNRPSTAQIIAVDVCGQRSDQTVIFCADSPTEIPSTTVTTVPTAPTTTAPTTTAPTTTGSADISAPTMMLAITLMFLKHILV